jgi:hypothetical protein
MDWALFWKAIWPLLVELGRELFKSTGGDPDKAKPVIRRMIDHKSEFLAAQPAFEERYRKLTQKE